MILEKTSKKIRAIFYDLFLICFVVSCVYKKPLTSNGDKCNSRIIVLNSIGNFETTDIDKEIVTQEIFKGNKLTMINVLSATCDSCMEELSDFAELSNEYKSKKIGILVVNMDIDSKGNPDESSRNEFLKIMNNKKSDMQIIFTNSNLINNLLSNINKLPYTFFIDNKGNVVGKEYSGYYTKKEWIKIIDKEFKNISANI